MNNNDMIMELFKAVDNMDAAKFASFLTEDVSFRFGNAAAVNGKDAVYQYVTDFFKAISILSHTIDVFVQSEEHIFVRGEVSYTRKDLSTLTIPYANYFMIHDGKIKKYQIYADTSELF